MGTGPPAGLSVEITGQYQVVTLGGRLGGSSGVGSKLIQPSQHFIGHSFHWRRERDSNPRYAFTHTRFPSVRLKPLGHLSKATPGAPGGRSIPPLTPVANPNHASIFNAARNADCGISTFPNCRIRFLPSFCFSSSFRLREMSPP
jgi:hypothetical protein